MIAGASVEMRTEHLTKYECRGLPLREPAQYVEFIDWLSDYQLAMVSSSCV
jgi:hypothetical protein